MVNKQGQTIPRSKADNRKEKEKETYKHNCRQKHNNNCYRSNSLICKSQNENEGYTPDGPID